MHGSFFLFQNQKWRPYYLILQLEIVQFSVEISLVAKHPFYGQINVNYENEDIFNSNESKSTNFKIINKRAKTNLTKR